MLSTITSTIKGLTNKVVSELEIRSGAERLFSMPAVVDLVLTKACNLACTFCKDYELDGAKNVTQEQMDRVIDQIFPSAKRLSICSGGEPYLHRGLEYILRAARRHNLYTWVLSNGMLLKEDRLRQIIEEELIMEHGFSVDGIEPPTVEAIRVFARLPVILENVKMVMRLRDEMGKAFPTITIRYALMRSNIEELPAAVDYWGRTGANRIDCGYLSLANGIPREQSLYFHQDLMVKIFEEARKIAAKYPKLGLNLPNTIKEEKKKKQNPQQCLAPWRFVMIDAGGGISPCYRSFEGLVMGNLFEDPTPFRNVWNSDKYRALRGTVNNDCKEKAFKYCGHCEMRYGWSDLAAHLGDETWLRVLADQSGEESLVQIDHRRLKK